MPFSWFSSRPALNLAQQLGLLRFTRNKAGFWSCLVGGNLPLVRQESKLCLRREYTILISPLIHRTLHFAGSFGNSLGIGISL